jgi:hypothetical protein
MRFCKLLPVALVVLVSACASTNGPSEVGGVESFLLENPAFGTLVSVNAKQDWAHGSRREVVTETDIYLFYFSGDEIIGVFTFVEREGRVFLTGTCYRADIAFPESRKTCPRQTAA